MASTISDLRAKAHEPRWLDYLFGNYGRVVLTNWARRLHYFRFVKALGGHANDGDLLLAVLRYANNADLRKLFAQLGLPTGPGRATGPVPSPGLIAWAGAKVYVAVRHAPQQLEFTIIAPDGSYDVTPQAVEAAEAVELLLAVQAPRIIDPPLRDHHCVCPAYYPELWAEPVAKATRTGRKPPILPEITS